MPDQSDRSLIGAIAAHERWARADADERRAGTAEARAALALTFEKQVDPDGTLDPIERARRAQNLRRAHMLRLARASADARRERKLAELRAEAEADIAELDGAA